MCRGKGVPRQRQGRGEWPSAEQGEQPPRRGPCGGTAMGREGPSAGALVGAPGPGGAWGMAREGQADRGRTSCLQGQDATQVGVPGLRDTRAGAGRASIAAPLRAPFRAGWDRAAATSALQSPWRDREPSWAGTAARRPVCAHEHGAPGSIPSSAGRAPGHERMREATGWPWRKDSLGSGLGRRLTGTRGRAWGAPGESPGGQKGRLWCG